MDGYIQYSNIDEYVCVSILTHMHGCTTHKHRGYSCLNLSQFGYGMFSDQVNSTLMAETSLMHTATLDIDIYTQKIIMTTNTYVAFVMC